MSNSRLCVHCKYQHLSGDRDPCCGCLGICDKPNWMPKRAPGTPSPDPTNPPHYKLPGGLEVIQVTRHLNLNRGSAVGYVLRAGRKILTDGQEVEDLRKAIWHLEDEIQRLTGVGGHAKP